MNDKTPLFDRFGRWAGGLVRGDLGRTVDGQPVNDEIGRRMWVSLRLLLIGAILGTDARRRGRRLQRGQAVSAGDHLVDRALVRRRCRSRSSCWPSCSRTPASG